MTLYRDQGIVLRTIKLGEADRIIVFCTKDRGKVRAVAKGVRKTKSRFGGRLEPASHLLLQCYEGRELDIVTQVETVESFRKVRGDFDRTRRAISMLEAVDHIAHEHQTDPGLYKMLVGALRSLENCDSPVIVAAFYWKLLAHDGVGPLVESCASCGKRDPNELVSFDIAQGGVLCRLCRHGSLMVSSEAIVLLKRIIGGDLARVLQEEPSSAMYELEHLADVSLETHLERRIRSRHVLYRV